MGNASPTGSCALPARPSRGPDQCLPALNHVFTCRLACGIIARSAGLFQNPKQICSCDGLTIWEERGRPIAGEGRKKPAQPPAQPPAHL